MTPNQTVAVNMLRLRKVRGWTQKELAAKLGWSAQLVCAAERSTTAKRNRHFTVDDLVLITEAFGVAPADLLAPVLPCATCQDSPPAGFACQECGAAGDPPSPASRAAGSASEPRRGNTR
jgi:transcriptional regulator with XRE-family HTH domain